MDLDYKLLQNDQKIDITNDSHFNDSENNDISYQILTQSQTFIDNDFKDTNEAIIFLTEAIPKSSDDFLDFLFSRFDYIKKLVDIDISSIQETDLKLILQMIYAITSLQIFRSNYNEIDSVYDYCIFTVKNLIQNCQKDETLTNIQLSLDCIINLTNENNFHRLNQSFFEEIIKVCFSTDEISINCSKIVEKMSNYIPPISSFQYYIDFLKYMCNNIDQTIAYYLYLTLLNLIKRYKNGDFQNIVRIPNDQQKLLLSQKPHSLPKFWVYEMILESYRYKYDVQSIVFDICSFLDSDTINILEDTNIKKNILNSLTKYEDERAISAIHALKNFLIINSEGYANYFTTEEIINMTPFLIKRVLQSPYKIKEEASYLLCFAMQCEPTFFAKGFIEPFSNGLSIKFALEFEEDAIISILSYDETDLLIQLLQGLLAIGNVCMEWRVTDELFAKFNEKIIPDINDMISSVDDKVADLMSNFIELLTPESKEI